VGAETADWFLSCRQAGSMARHNQPASKAHQYLLSFTIYHLESRIFADLADYTDFVIPSTTVIQEETIWPPAKFFLLNDKGEISRVFRLWTMD
jgi:hypothetical protein